MNKNLLALAVFAALTACTVPAFASTEGKCRHMAAEWRAQTKAAYKAGRVNMAAIDSYRHPELRQHLKIEVVAEMMRYGFQPQSGPVGADWVTTYNKCLAVVGS